MNEKKQRLIVLTDINRGVEIDDIQSLVRLLLYSNEIDIEGIIACTSKFLQKGGRNKHKNRILRVINAYEKVKSNLDIHASGYPDADYLRSISCCGIDKYGESYGNGFAESKYNDNEGVKLIIDAVDKNDERPVWFSLWGGANTLAQAVWKVSKERNDSDFDRFLSKLRIYAISDQDNGGLWLRQTFGDKLFYIVSPNGEVSAKHFYKATWPGISADKSGHGYNGKRNTKIAFKGANYGNISRRWSKKNVQKIGIYGKEYPTTHWLTEGDTPSYLSLIPNGLNVAEHPDYGGWGGRYVLRKPSFDEFLTEEKYPIWTNAEDKVKGVDGKIYVSAQATIWRWREEIQNDFAARMRWTQTPDYTKANHAPQISLGIPNKIIAKSGEKVKLIANVTDPNGGKLFYQWFDYPEAGTNRGSVQIENETDSRAFLTVPKAESGNTVHVILKVTNNGTPNMTSYARIIIEIQNER